MRLIAFIAAFAAVYLALAGCNHRPAEPLPATVRLQHGPFEIVAEGRRIRTGSWFSPNGGDPYATTDTTSFTVRWQGRDVSVPRVGTRFWRVLRLLDAPQPALLVMTTDFHLITETGGRLEVRSFGAPSTDLAELQWLDSAQGQPGPAQTFGIQKVEPQAGTALRGGRWLRLGHTTVLDVQTLQAHEVRPWVPERQPLAGLNAGGIAARAFSPGGTQWVALATDYDYENKGEPYEGLVVIDIPSGQAYGLRLSRQTTRYSDFDDINAAWVAHYFEWGRDATGRERLQPRRGVKPLPWQGRFIDFGDHVEYRVAPVADEMHAVLKRFIVERLAARVVPDGVNPSRTDGNTFALPGCDHMIAVSRHDDHVGLYVPTPAAPPWVRCQDSVRRVGEAINAELASGRHDAMFTTR